VGHSVSAVDSRAAPADAAELRDAARAPGAAQLVDGAGPHVEAELPVAVMLPAEAGLRVEALLLGAELVNGVPFPAELQALDEEHSRVSAHFLLAAYSPYAVRFHAKLIPADKNLGDAERSGFHFLRAVQFLHAVQLHLPSPGEAHWTAIRFLHAEQHSPTEGTRWQRSADEVLHCAALRCCVPLRMVRYSPVVAHYRRLKLDDSRAPCRARRRG
jgi:hypothetical protein